MFFLTINKLRDPRSIIVRNRYSIYIVRIRKMKQIFIVGTVIFHMNLFNPFLKTVSYALASGRYLTQVPGNAPSLNG